jgi:hypothetical protein
VGLFGEKSRSETTATSTPDSAEGFLPRRVRRRAESILTRVVATGGIVGIGTAVAAILGTADVSYWIVGLVASIVSVVFAAVLWSSRML